MNTLLFLCTGNYYRSRFAEHYFRHIARQRGLDWNVDSRGLALSSNNVGPLSRYTHSECQGLGISVEPLRMPQWLTLEDLQRATLTIAVKESEHRPLIRKKFPEWETRIEYWEIDDLDCATPDEALPILRQKVDHLVERLCSSSDLFSLPS